MFGCSGQCSTCDAGSGGGGGLHGGRLVLSATCAFLAPLALALVGGGIASHAGQDRAAQLIGALSGLAVGMLAAWAVHKAIVPKNPPTPLSEGDPAGPTGKENS